MLAFSGGVSYNQLQLNTAGGRMEKIPQEERPYADRALETPIELGAEGASAAALNSQAKGQRFPFGILWFFDGSRCKCDPFSVF
jgi:hypothetical protein